MSNSIKIGRKPSKRDWKRKYRNTLPNSNIVDESIRLFLDDERPCPDGYVLARTPKEFFTLLADKTITDRISVMSLDWHLGCNWADGCEIAAKLCNMFNNDPSFLPKLDEIRLHSSDPLKAREMFNIFKQQMPEARFEDILIG